MMRITKEGRLFVLFWEGVLWKKIEKITLPYGGVQEVAKSCSLPEAEECFNRLECKAAKAYVLKLLNERALFHAQIQEKMQRKGFSCQAITFALEFCTQIGGIDDKSLAKEKCEREIRKGKGFFMAQQKIGRWVNREDCFLPVETIHELEKTAIQKVLEKKKVDYSVLSFPEKQKIFLFLLKRGFKKEHIQEVLLSITE